MNLMENRLLLYGSFNGYPDFDVNSEQLYHVQRYNTSGYNIMSIYSLEGGLELTGQYFTNNSGNRY